MHLTFLADRANVTTGRVLVGNGAAILKWGLAAWAGVAIGVLAVRAALSRRRC